MIIFAVPFAWNPFPSFAPEKSGLVGLAFAIALVLTLLLTPLAMHLAARAGVLDYPHERRVHTKPTPRWGGLAMFAAFTLTVLALTLPHNNLARHFTAPGGIASTLLNSRVIGILLGGALITLLGAIDDKFSVPARYKLAGQILIACILPLFGVRMVVAFDTNLHWLVGSLLTVLWVVAITNTINLIDGLDGLAAGVSGLAVLTFLGIGMMRGTFGFDILAAALAGACFGFLRYNFHPARVFMGDAGSHFLGYTIAALSVLQNWKVATGIAFAVPVLILAVPIFDTTFAIVRRLRRGQPIFSPDKGHLHHRLLSSGMDQRAAVLCIYTLTLLGCFLAFWLARARLWD